MVLMSSFKILLKVVVLLLRRSLNSITPIAGISPGGIFVCEELDFPDTRKDMNLNNEYPTLKEILKAIKNNADFNSKYIEESDKQYFLKNFKSIKIFNGKKNEVAVIEKK